MYILFTFWALLALFYRAIDCVHLRFGMRFAAVAAVPALLLSWLLSCALGYGALWDTFFPSWLVAGAAAVGNAACDYLLDHVLWQVSR